MLRCNDRGLLVLAALGVYFLACSAYTQAQDPEQYLRDQYQGRTLVLRGFYSANRLRYDASGTPQGTAAGDWTEYGFALVQDIHVQNERLIIHATRFLVVFIGKQFELRPASEPHGKAKMGPAVLMIEADFPQHNPSPAQIDALMSRIVLTAQDHLAEMVPDYWSACVRRGVAGDEKKCIFSSEILGIPGVANSGVANMAADQAAAPASSDQFGFDEGVFLVRGGISAPRAIFNPEPEFTESARRAKFMGTVDIGLVVNKQGKPTNIRILKPLGAGLDAQAVHTVETWRFQPATKDGRPVNVAIAVEVDFHLY